MFLVNSTISILSKTNIYWESNHARLGGAIYADDIDRYHCTEYDVHTKEDECFFQLPGQNLSNGIDAKFIFKDNSADAGSVLYGGTVDYCKLTDLGSYSSGEVFDKLVKIENGNANSSISSDPFRICPCENNHPNYNKSHKSYRIHPGETFYVSVIAVGQRNGTIPTTVRGRLMHTPHTIHPFTTIGHLQPLQYLQKTVNACTILNYTVFSLDTVVLELYADGPFSTCNNKLDLYMDVYKSDLPTWF